MATRTNYISVCAGAAGLDLAVELALPSTRPVLYVERELPAAAVLAARAAEGAIPDAPVWSDLHTLDPGPWRGLVDGVVGGIPCQGNSLAGRRLLEADERNLWPAFWRLAREVGAWFVVVENVPGIAIPGGDKRSPADGILEDLAESGWDAEWLRLPASGVGAAHRRERWFLMAYQQDGRCGGDRLQLQPGRPSQASAESIGGTKAMADAQRGECRVAEAGGRYYAGDAVGRPSETMDDATRINGGCGPGRRRGGSRGGQSTAPDYELDHTPSPRLNGAGPGSAALLGVGECVSGEGCEDVAYASKPGPQGLAALASKKSNDGDAGRSGGAEVLSVFAPGPDDPRWADILVADPSLEPAVCGMVGGLAGRLDLARADRLRLTGNGVVPLQAAIAIRELVARIARLS